MKRKAIIQAVNLCKTYMGTSEQYHAVRNVNLDIYEGDFTVIMGNSGSGKSTLLYMLSGLDSVTAGEVYVQGKRIDQLDEHALSVFRTKQIGYVYQSINLVPDLSVMENICLPGYIAGRSRSEVKRQAVALARQMGIDKQLHRLPNQISGGQQQRAAIARALLNQPQIVFADEPTGSLNYDHGLAVLDLLTAANRQGQSVVMVTHDMKAASRADRLILIRDGKIAGVLDLGRFEEKQSEARERMIFSYVTGKE